MQDWSMELRTVVDQYASGPHGLDSLVAGMTAEQWRTAGPPGKWSPLEVVAHLADFEIVYAERISRILAEDRPTMFSGDPDQFAARLAYAARDPHEQLAVIRSVRAHVSRLLRAQAASAFERVGVHSSDGPIALSVLVGRIARHLPHHAEFIRQKIGR